MILEFIVEHEIEGVKIISNPDGWLSSVLTLERHADFASIQKYFKTAFNAYGKNNFVDGGRDFFILIEKTHGPDAIVKSTIRVSLDDRKTWSILFLGSAPVKMMTQILDDWNIVQMAFLENNLWTKLISNFDKTVDIRSTTTLEGEAVTPAPTFSMLLPSQTIRQEYEGHLKNNFHYGIIEYQKYAVLDVDDDIINEIEKTYSYGLLPGVHGLQITEVPFEKFYFPYKGTGRIQGSINIASRNNGSADTTNFERLTVVDIDNTLNIYLKIGNQSLIKLSRVVENIPNQTIIPNPSSSSNIDDIVLSGTTYSKFNFDYENIPLKKGDTVKLYIVNDGGKNDAENSTILFGREGDSYILQSYAGFFGSPTFGGYWDPSSGLFPEPIFESAPSYSKLSYKISKDGAIHGIDVYEEWFISFIGPGNPFISAEVQDPVNWYIGEKAPTEGKFVIADTYLKMTADTLAEDSEAEVVLLHDLLYAIVDRAVRKDCLWTEVLGNLDTVRTYLETGKFSNYVAAQGLQLRGYSLTDKPLSASAKEIWNSINPAFNLGMGLNVKTIDDVETEVIEVVEKRNYFKDVTPVVNLYNVKKISKTWDEDFIFSEVNIGNEKWESDGSSGLDDFQTKHTYLNILKNIGKKITLYSKIIFASILIEKVRRISIKKSKDDKNDNDLFLISVVKDGDYKPRLNEGFTSTTGIVNPNNRYNKILSPGRAFLRWRDYLSGLQSFIGSFKFTKGEGNFSMSSTMTDDGTDETFGGASLSENQDIPIGANPYFLPLCYTIEHSLPVKDLLTILQDPYIPIGVSLTSVDPKPFYIKILEHTLMEGQVKLLAWPKEYFDLTTVDDFENEHEIIEPKAGVFDDGFAHPPFN